MIIFLTLLQDPRDPGGPVSAVDDAEVVSLVLRPQRHELDAVVAVEPDARPPAVAPRTLLEELQAPLVPETDYLLRNGHSLIVALHTAELSSFSRFSQGH